jgi:hypothetical protein
VKGFSLSLLFVSSAILWSAGPLSGQAVSQPDPSTFKILNPPRRPARTEAEKAFIGAQAQTGATLPLWTYSIVSPVDSNTYTGNIVGRNPYFHGHRSTTIQTYLVPVIITLADGNVFNPTGTDSCIEDSVVHSVLNSPIYDGVSFTLNNVNMGVTQYPDAYQQANFWSVVSPAPTYHTLLGVTQLAAQSVTIPAGHGYTEYAGCGGYAVIDYNWFDNYVRTTLMPKLASSGVGPTNVPIFIFDSVVEYLNGQSTNCCAVGEHGSYTNGSGLLQSYIISDFDTSGEWEPDVSILSHEVADWMNDPANSNTAPAWGQSGSCSTAYEVAEPLEGYIWQIQGQDNVSYNLEEIAFFSWFYRQSPSIGAGQLYSDLGRYTTSAGAVCH